MVDSVLTLARFDANTSVQISHGRVQLKHLAELVIGEFVTSTRERNIDVRCTGDQETVPGDQEALAILLRHLLSNAIRHARADLRRDWAHRSVHNPCSAGRWPWVHHGNRSPRLSSILSGARGRQIF